MTIQQLADTFNLRPKEALALAYMLDNEGYASLRSLATAIGLSVEAEDWGDTHNNLSVVIHNLRKKLPPNSVINRRGYGFKADREAVFG